MESFLVQTISSDSVLAAMFGNRPASKWLFAASSLGKGNNPEAPEPRPYIVWNELASVPAQEVSETSDAQWRTFTLWVYDNDGSYDRINAILRELRRIVKAMDFFTAPDGTRCSKVRWDGFSGNFPDQRYSLITRYGTARFMVSQ